MSKSEFMTNVPQVINHILAKPSDFISINTDKNSTDYGKINLKTNKLSSVITIKDSNIDSLKFNDLSYRYLKTIDNKTVINQQKLRLKINEIDNISFELIIEPDANIKDVYLLYNDQPIVYANQHSRDVDYEGFTYSLKCQLDMLELRLQKNHLI